MRSESEIREFLHYAQSALDGMMSTPEQPPLPAASVMTNAIDVAEWILGKENTVSVFIGQCRQHRLDAIVAETRH